MNLFNRALARSFEKKRTLFLAAVLAICGLLIVLGRGFGLYTRSFGELSLFFFSTFVAIAFLFTASVVIIRLSYQEAKQLASPFRQLLFDSLDPMVAASYISVPFVLSYLILWVLLGILLLLKQIPMLGSFLSVALIFGPFLLIFTSFFLIFLAFIALFFLAPKIALSHSLGIKTILRQTFKEIGQDFFGHLRLAILALLPSIVVFVFLWLAALWAKEFYDIGPYPLEKMIQELVLMVPFVVILTPTVHFFFNCVVEQHLLEEESDIVF